MSMLWGLFSGFVIVGAAFAGRALAHWRELAAFGPICGDSTVHCGWCYAATASLLAAAITLAFAVRADRRVVAPAKIAA